MMDDPCDEWPMLAPSPRIATIKRVVADTFDILPRFMVSADRHREVARPRQAAMFLARRMTRHSLPEIGRHFGNRDHTTVLYAVRHVERLRRSNPEFSMMVSRAWLQAMEAA